LGWWDTLAAVLLVAALLTTAGRLIVTGWTDHLGVVGWMTLVGGLAGLALGASAFSQRCVVLLATIYGLFFGGALLGVTMVEEQLWIDRLINLIERLLVSLLQLVRQDPVEDPLLFVWAMTVLFWILSVHAAYHLARHGHPWRSTIPAGLVLLIVHSYNAIFETRTWFLALYLFFVLMILARMAYLRYQIVWQRDRISVPSYVGLDLIGATLQIVLVLIVVAWLTPVIFRSVSPLRQAWRHVSGPWATVRDRLSHAVVSLREQVGGVQNIYGDTLSLGSGNPDDDEVLLVVQVEPGFSSVPRYYWRARVYDHYAGGEWRTGSISRTQEINSRDVASNFTQGEQGRTGTFTMTTAAPISTLFTPGRVLWVSRPARADLALNPDGTADVFALHANPPVQAGESYQIRAFLNDVSVATLRAAGADYPDWIVDRYVQLPPEITPRVRELAHRIADGLDNPYDIVVTITTYLRRRIEYRRVLADRWPDYQEPVDWFLFDAQQGYCSYYATAEVIMLRALGIPARLAVGYGQGDLESGSRVYVVDAYNRRAWSDDSDVYVVRRRNAHAWPEVYFPGIGWIPFEPSAIYPSIDRPLGEDDEADTSFDGSLLDLELEEDASLEQRLREFLAEKEIPVEALPALQDRRESNWNTWLLALTPVALVIGLILVWQKRLSQHVVSVPVLLRRGLRRLDIQTPSILQRWSVYTTLSTQERAYLQINAALKRLGSIPHPSDTPAERARALRHILPQASRAIQRVLDEYQASYYGSRPGNAYAAQDAGREIRRQSWEVKLRRFFTG